MPPWHILYLEGNEEQREDHPMALAQTDTETFDLTHSQGRDVESIRRAVASNPTKQCPQCHKRFMSVRQREHHEQNADRLCPR
jgi:hypothetical protein